MSWGVAMGDAHPDVHAAADLVAGAVDVDGVAVFLEPMLDRLENGR